MIMRTLSTIKLDDHRRVKQKLGGISLRRAEYRTFEFRGIKIEP